MVLMVSDRHSRWQHGAYSRESASQLEVRNNTSPPSSPPHGKTRREATCVRRLLELLAKGKNKMRRKLSHLSIENVSSTLVFFPLTSGLACHGAAIVQVAKLFFLTPWRPVTLDSVGTPQTVKLKGVAAT